MAFQAFGAYLSTPSTCGFIFYNTVIIWPTNDILSFILGSFLSIFFRLFIWFTNYYTFVVDIFKDLIDSPR